MFHYQYTLVTFESNQLSIAIDRYKTSDIFILLFSIQISHISLNKGTFSDKVQTWDSLFILRPLNMKRDEYFPYPDEFQQLIA